MLSNTPSFMIFFFRDSGTESLEGKLDRRPKSGVNGVLVGRLQPLHDLPGGSREKGLKGI